MFEWIPGYALPFLVTLTIVVFFHELGHYLVARWNGVRVEVFSIGMGREIFGFTDRAGTRWKFSLFPLGGYVRMFSDANAASQADHKKVEKMTEADKKVSLFHKTVWQRMAISIAGPIANFVFAIAVWAVLYASAGQRMASEEALIGPVMAQSAAAEAGIELDDMVLSVNGQAIRTFEEVREFARNSPETPLKMVVRRGDETLTLTVVPKKMEETTEAGETITVGILGVQQGAVFVQRGLFEALYHATADVGSVTLGTLKAVGQMFTGTRSTDGLSGVIGIAQITGNVASAGLVTFIWFMAYLSLNLGLINLFPIPMLDGGHLLFYGAEAIRGKPLSEQAQEWGFRVGLLIIVGLVLLSTWNDLSRLKVIQAIMGIF